MAPSFSAWEPCGGRARCSLKTATAMVCTCNIVAALYVLRLLSPVYIFPSPSGPGLALLGSSSKLTLPAKYSEAQLSLMRKALDIWRKAEPVELVKRVEEIQKESLPAVLSDEQMESLREDVASELIKKLEELRSAGNKSLQLKALEQWRKVKLDVITTREQEARVRGENHEVQQAVQAADGMKFLLTTGWSSLLEDAGWEGAESETGEEIPSDSEIEKEAIPGRALPPVCHAEIHTDYDGAAVRWGLSFHVESAADCCQACIDQAKSAKPDQIKCNIWVYCPHEAGCYSPDIYEHKHHECWLKQAVKPRLNFKGKYSPEYRWSHPTAPVVVPWVSGVLTSS